MRGLLWMLFESMEQDLISLLLNYFLKSLLPCRKKTKCSWQGPWLRNWSELWNCTRLFLSRMFFYSCRSVTLSSNYSCRSFWQLLILIDCSFGRKKSVAFRHDHKCWRKKCSRDGSGKCKSIFGNFRTFSENSFYRIDASLWNAWSHTCLIVWMFWAMEIILKIWKSVCCLS